MGEFRCGKMKMKGTQVTADKRKGLLYVHLGEDSLTHLCWKDRVKGKVEDDLIFPDDCEWKKVDQCTTGRVFVLKFKSSLRKMFFWMQEPKGDKDEDLSKKVNDSLNNPPKLSGRGGNAGSGLSDLTEVLNQGNIQDLFNNVDSQQLLQMMAAGGGLSNLLTPQSSRSSSSSRRSGSSVKASAPTTTTPSTPVNSTATTAQVTPKNTSAPSSEPPKAPVKLSALQNILDNMNVEKASSKPVDLAEVCNPQDMAPILCDPKVQERLRPHLRSGLEALNPDELFQTPRSHHFKQAMASFSIALASGQLGPLLQQFGISTAAKEAADKGDIEGFAKAMQDGAKTENKEGEVPNASQGEEKMEH